MRVKSSKSEFIKFKPIGVIHSEHEVAENTPIQPVFAKRCRGSVTLFREYGKGLSDIESFSHLLLIYHFHMAGRMQLSVKPFLDDQLRGVFSTRHPSRPNGIGLSVVKLISRKGLTLQLEGLDILDGTPLLDIKPYIHQLDYPGKTHSGWFEKIDSEIARSRGLRGYKPGGKK